MLPSLTINYKCIFCDNCRLICPEGAITYDKDFYLIDTWLCSLCNICVELCPVDCIQYTTRDNSAKEREVERLLHFPISSKTPS
ncbi:MAG: 4Fe-4S binding protein [Oligoflexia bacterium]|nr:4Fe-4S binding protein [Oligoflexia bacterium]